MFRVEEGKDYFLAVTFSLLVLLGFGLLTDKITVTFVPQESGLPSVNCSEGKLSARDTQITCITPPSGVTMEAQWKVIRVGQV